MSVSDASGDHIVETYSSMGLTTSITPLTQTYNILQHSKAKKTLSLCKYDLRKGDLFVLSWARV